jgi:hypothetical protein
MATVVAPVAPPQPTYAAQPYQQLAAVERTRGYDGPARRILIAQQDDLGRRSDIGRWHTRLIHWTWGKLAGCGYRAGRRDELVGGLMATVEVSAPGVAWDGIWLPELRSGGRVTGVPVSGGADRVGDAGLCPVTGRRRCCRGAGRRMAGRDRSACHPPSPTIDRPVRPAGLSNHRSWGEPLSMAAVEREAIREHLNLAWSQLGTSSGDLDMPDPIAHADIVTNWSTFRHKLTQRILDRTCEPSQVEIVDLPKNRLTVRPLARLELEHRLAYEAAVLASVQQIDSMIPRAVRSYRWWKRKRRLLGLAGSWIRMQRDARLLHQKQPSLLLARTDVTSFYEHVDAEILIDCLAPLPIPAWAIENLGNFLRAFNSPQQRVGNPSRVQRLRHTGESVSATTR